MKSTKFVRLFLMGLILPFVACQDYNVEDIGWTEESQIQAEKDLNFQSDISHDFQTYLLDQDTSSAIAQIIKDLSKNKSVRQVSSIDNGVWIRYKSGMVGGVFLPDWDLDSSFQKPMELKIKAPSTTTTPIELVSSRKAILLITAPGPIQMDQMNIIKHLEELKATALIPAKINLSIFWANQVTLELLTQLSGYGVIATFCHGIPMGKEGIKKIKNPEDIAEVYIISGESYNKETFEKYYDEIKTGDIPIVSFSSDHKFCISSKFLSKHNDFSNDKTIYYGISCFSGNGSWPSITEKFKSCAYFGHDWSVAMPYGFMWFYYSLTKVSSINQSKPQTVQDWWNNPYPPIEQVFDNRKVHLNLFGNKDISLIEFPKVETYNIHNITSNSAQGGGNLISIGTGDPISHGICWSKHSNPTILDFKTEDGTELGTFNSYLAGLIPQTEYAVRSYMKTSHGISYGGEVVFKTILDIISFPTVSTSSIGSITKNSAIGGGNVTSDGNLDVTARGICWSINPDPTLNNTNLFTEDGSGLGTFTSIIASLLSNTTYYLTAYATNSFGTAYGAQVSFKTNPELTKPVVTTSIVSNITTNSAISGGFIISDGGSSVTAKGICWSPTANPTLANNKTSDGTGTGTFTSQLTGLMANTTYYIRAYATNNAGTGYGDQKQFTTSSGGGNGTFDYDGRTYAYKTIGTQTWMTENLAYLPSVNPSSATSITTPYYYVYGYEGSTVASAKGNANYTTYGVLYNWPAALTACPSEWHLPTDEEWKVLETYLGISATDSDMTGFRGTTQGVSLKTGGSSGFDAKLAGWWSNVFTSFSEIEINGYFWSSSPSTASDSWARKLALTENGVGRYKILNNNGLSVRCIKN